MFKNYIERFRADFEYFGMVHAGIYHIIDFCEPRQACLAFWGESITSQPRYILTKYKCVSIENSNYPLNLLEAMSDYNAKHV